MMKKLIRVFMKSDLYKELVLYQDFFASAETNKGSFARLMEAEENMKNGAEGGEEK